MTIELYTEYNKFSGGDENNAVVTQGGTWTITSSAIGFPVVIGGSSYILNSVVGDDDNPSMDFNDLSSGAYDFTYTITAASGCIGSAVFTVNVVSSPIEPNTFNLSVCSEDSNAVNFADRIFSGPTDGTFQLVSAPLGHTTPSSFTLPQTTNFLSEPTGFYEYIYVVDNANGCTESDTVSLEIVGTVLQPADLDVCTSDPIIILLDELPDDYSVPTHGAGTQQIVGSWSVVSGSPGAAFNAGAGTFNPSAASVGNYILRYTYDVISKYHFSTCQRIVDVNIDVSLSGIIFPNQPGTVCVN